MKRVKTYGELPLNDLLSTIGKKFCFTVCKQSFGKLCLCTSELKACRLLSVSREEGWVVEYKFLKWTHTHFSME